MLLQIHVQNLSTISALQLPRSGSGAIPETKRTWFLYLNRMQNAKFTHTLMQEKDSPGRHFLLLFTWVFFSSPDSTQWDALSNPAERKDPYRVALHL